MRKKELWDWHNNGSEDREPKCSHYPVKSTARSMSMREQWLVKQRMAVLRNDHILSFGEVFKNLTHLLELFQRMVCHQFVAHGQLSQMCVPHLLTVMHTCCLSVHRSLRCTRGIHCEYVRILWLHVKWIVEKHVMQLCRHFDRKEEAFSMELEEQRCSLGAFTIRPGLLSHISHFTICVWVGGHYLFLANAIQISANLRCCGGCVWHLRWGVSHEAGAGVKQQIYFAWL